MPEELQEMKVTNDQLEKIARLIVGIAAVPEFPIKNTDIAGCEDIWKIRILGKKRDYRGMAADRTWNLF